MENETLFRGSYRAKIDVKGRLKIPTKYFNIMLETFGRDIFVTSHNGKHAIIYPMIAWREIEDKMLKLPSMNPDKRKFLNITNYYGQQTQLDAQGRAVIQPALRESAVLQGEVVVVGLLNYLEVWNNEEFVKKQLSDPMSYADFQKLSDVNI